MRLTFVIGSLGSGGAERVLTIMANYWTSRDWTVTIITLNDGSQPPFYNLDERIHVVPAWKIRETGNQVKRIFNSISRINKLRSAINRSAPQIIISFIDISNIFTILSTRGSRIPVVISERTDPAKHFIGEKWNRLRRWTYPFADRLVVQHKQVAKFFPENIQQRIRVIPNPVIQPPPIQNAEVLIPWRPNLLTVGRLSVEKRHDLLISAFVKLAGDYPDWHLTIIGDGPLRSTLEMLVSNSGLADRIHMLGKVRSPYDYYRQSDLFVLSSRYEGFPNALCEAMACGLPVISSNCSGIVPEIINNTINGIVIPPEDKEALIEAMADLMHNETSRKKMGALASDVIDRFSIEKVMGMWEAVLGEVLR